MNKYITKHLILYFDILGYKQLLKEFRTQNDYLKFIDDGFKTVDKIIDVYKEMEIKKVVFSDNVVIFIDLNKCTSDTIFQFLKMACLIQNYLVLQSVFIRGAIVVGDLYFSSKPTYLFGQGIVDAYNIENSEAIYPRVLISDQCVKIFEEQNIDKHIFLKDFDGKYFLNYMYIIGMLLIDNSVEIDLKYKSLSDLQNTRFIITNTIEVFKNDSKVFEKYKWVAKYYNRFLKMINLDSMPKFKILFINEETWK